MTSGMYMVQTHRQGLKDAAGFQEGVFALTTVSMSLSASFADGWSKISANASCPPLSTRGLPPPDNMSEPAQ